MAEFLAQRKTEIFLFLLGTSVCAITIALANSQLGFYAVLVLPLAVLFLIIITSVELTAYLVIFSLFSGIFWGLEIAGGFLLVTLFFIAAWLLQKSQEAEPYLFVDKTLFAIFVYLLFLLISVTDARWPIVSFGMLLIYGKLILFYLIFTNAVDKQIIVKRAIWVLIAAVIISVTYGFYTILGAVSKGQLFETGFRLIGLSANPNALSYYILISIALLAYFFFLTAKKWQAKVLIVLMIIYLTIAQGATLSRGGSIGLAILFLLIIWDFRQRKWPVVIVLIFIAVILLFAPEAYFERLSSLSNIYSDPSLRWRARLSIGAIELIQQYPFNGIGLGNFLVVSNKYIAHHLVTHNTILEVFSESGFLAALSLVILVVIVFRNLMNASAKYAADENWQMYAISRAFRSSLIALSVLSFFDSMQTYFSIWAIFAFATILNRLAQAGKDESAK